MKLVAPSDPILTQVAAPVVFPSAALSRTVSEMFQIMLANRGLGLAAPQVGLDVRLFTYKIGNAIGTIINPAIIEKSREQIDVVEGCLTWPGRQFRTRRAKWVSVVYSDMSGAPCPARRLDGLMAIVFQHEFDHLNGRLISQYGVEEPR